MISLKDIARICDVSESTVSKALKQRPEIRAATRERIQTVARQYHYQPNAIVESIQTGRSRTIGVAYNNFTDGFAGRIMTAVLDTLYGQEYDTMVICWDLIVKQGADVLSRFSRRRVDGLLLFPMVQLPSPYYLEELRSFHNPVVVIDQTWPGNEFAFVGSEHQQGAEIATEHMIERGLTNLGCIYCSTTSSGQERYAGFLNVMARHGVPVRANSCLDLKNCFDRNYARIRQLLDRPDRPEGLVCFNDYCAFEAQAVAYDLGLRIPEQLSLVGFGDLPLAALMRPQLTTVSQFPEEIGHQAAVVVLSELERKKTGQTAPQVRTPVKLIIRESVK